MFDDEKKTFSDEEQQAAFDQKTGVFDEKRPLTYEEVCIMIGENKQARKQLEQMNATIEDIGKRLEELKVHPLFISTPLPNGDLTVRT